MEYFERSLSLSRELGDPAGIATELANMSVVAYVQGELTRARSLATESLTMRRDLAFAAAARSTAWRACAHAPVKSAAVRLAAARRPSAWGALTCWDVPSASDRAACRGATALAGSAATAVRR